MKIYNLLFIVFFLSSAQAAEVKAPRVKIDLEKIDLEDEAWTKAASETIDLTAQPMVVPRPATTTTEKLTVQALFNETRLALRLSWADSEASEAGRLARQSDAVAVQFPVRTTGETPPIVFMGSPGDPVHIFHWRAQYQRDAERGKPTVKDLYPNMSVDMYPMEFKDHGKIAKIADSEREKYSPAVAVGNPQSYPKTGVDEVIAEGFGTSSVKKPSRIQSSSKALWKKGIWQVVISRPLVSDDGSNIAPEKGSLAAFAVWQGGQGEVGSRKSVSIMWTPIVFNVTEGRKP